MNIIRQTALIKAVKPLLILVDMDGVLSDFDGHLEQRCRELGNLDLIDKLKQRTTMKLEDPIYNKQVIDIVSKPGFFYNLPVIPGSREAIKEMIEEGHKVMICTTPIGARCIQEKYMWLEDFIGKEWLENIVMTSDKTVIQGDYIIDDNHQMTGFNDKPTWEHILFDRFYNQHDKTPGRRRMKTWSDWRKFITPK